MGARVDDSSHNGQVPGVCRVWSGRVPAIKGLSFRQGGSWQMMKQAGPSLCSRPSEASAVSEGAVAGSSRRAAWLAPERPWHWERH